MATEIPLATTHPEDPAGVVWPLPGQGSRGGASTAEHPGAQPSRGSELAALDAMLDSQSTGPDAKSPEQPTRAAQLPLTEAIDPPVVSRVPGRHRRSVPSISKRLASVATEVRAISGVLKWRLETASQRLTRELSGNDNRKQRIIIGVIGAAAIAKGVLLATQLGAQVSGRSMAEVTNSLMPDMLSGDAITTGHEPAHDVGNQVGVGSEHLLANIQVTYPDELMRGHYGGGNLGDSPVFVEPQFEVTPGPSANSSAAPQPLAEAAPSNTVQPGQVEQPAVGNADGTHVDNGTNYYGGDDINTQQGGPNGDIAAPDAAPSTVAQQPEGMELGPWDSKTGKGSVEYAAKVSLGYDDVPNNQLSPAQRAQIFDETQRLLELNDIDLDDADELSSSTFIRFRN